MGEGGGGEGGRTAGCGRAGVRGRLASGGRRLGWEAEAEDCGKGCSSERRLVRAATGVAARGGGRVGLLNLVVN